MRWRAVSLTALIGVIGTERLAAQNGDASRPCSLLAAAQISAAVGPVGKSAEGNMPGTGRGANPVRKACSYGIPGGLFTLSVGKVPKTELNTRQTLDYINSMYDMLKGQGWKYEKKDFGSTSCSVLTPPAGDATSSPATSCGTIVKGMLVMASASSKTSVPAEKLKPLLETAAARLP